MKKYVCISDTHTQHRDLILPEGDVLIHTGDFSYTGNVRETEDFLKWLKDLPFKDIVFIEGNHDFLGENNPSKFTELYIIHYREGIHHLRNSSCIIDGIKFYGSPVSPFFYAWAWNVHRGNDIKLVWDRIPVDTNILLTHGPIYGILDKTKRGEEVGCADLRNRIQNLKELKVHQNGHIHESYGEQTINGVKYINACVLNERYQIQNKPIEFEL